MLERKTEPPVFPAGPDAELSLRPALPELQTGDAASADRLAASGQLQLVDFTAVLPLDPATYTGSHNQLKR